VECGLVGQRAASRGLIFSTCVNVKPATNPNQWRDPMVALDLISHSLRHKALPMPDPF